jgi:hypothetical protein
MERKTKRGTKMEMEVNVGVSKGCGVDRSGDD